MQHDIESIINGGPASAPAPAVAPSGVEALLTELERAFPPLVVKPDTTMPHIQYSAGQQSVIAWLKHRAAKRQGAGR